MKKLFLITMLVLGSASFCFSSGNKEMEFDPTSTIFEGEWRDAEEKWNDSVYVFTGNSWKYTCNDESKGSGRFTFNNNSITLYMENGKKFWNKSPKYIVTPSTIKFISTDGWLGGFKQPVKAFSSDNEFFSKLQGTWKAGTVNVTYIFSGNKFNCTPMKDLNNLEGGTFEINDDGILKIITSEGEMLFVVEFTTDKLLWLEPFSSISITWGSFIKQ